MHHSDYEMTAPLRLIGRTECGPGAPPARPRTPRPRRFDRTRDNCGYTFTINTERNARIIAGLRVPLSLLPVLHESPVIINNGRAPHQIGVLVQLAEDRPTLTRPVRGHRRELFFLNCYQLYITWICCDSAAPNLYHR
ncbi:hypothetical protein EVAR_75072_1 [Eumeta japonica]|uniref:Uncharacterized protein n=1 Tax=Eumeta variegata TaxID=151549 RepID=A0A4C1W3G3_EUMVA|nr:hypothetical protein EVAR_75072_1 [Eumeta japonica]